MSVIAEGERVGVGRGERIGAMTILRGGLLRLRSGGWQVGLVTLVIFGLGWAGAPVQGMLGIEETSGPAYWAYLAATMVLEGVLAALATRVLIDGPAGWLKLDRGLIEYVAIVCVLGAVLTAVGLGYSTMAARQYQQNGGVDPQAMLWFALATVAAYAVALYVWFRLSLWPLARLMGRREITPGRAWRLMLRATRGLLFAYALAAMPIVLIYLGAFGASGWVGIDDVPAWVEYLCVAAWSVASYGMVATIYHLRVENPATVADVFA